MNVIKKNMELPIIKIIKAGYPYADKTYKVGEIIVVAPEKAEELIKKGYAEKTTNEELQKYEEKQFGKRLRGKAEQTRIDKLQKIKLENYMDNVRMFYHSQPFFYDKNCIFWFWNWEENRYKIVDDTDVMIKLDNILGLEGQTVGTKTKANYLEAFKRVGRSRIPKESKKKWIQFKDKAFSIYSGKIHKVTPDYFFTNPIPQELGDLPDTPVMDKLFEEWVGTKYMDTLYEIIAYCCYTSYPIQLLFCLYGSGRNGKSKYMELLRRFIGQENVTSTELDTLLNSRFETFKLYKKLVCSLGETNFGVISKTSMLKKLVGGDVIGYEMKNKNPFDDVNYAKIIIGSNSLPSSNDTSEGFYRRWLIIDFPNEFPDVGKDILETVPEQEYSNLAKKITLILPKLLKRGTFLNQGDIEERKTKYIMSSNPISMFIKKCCFMGYEEFVSYNELYTAYIAYLKKFKKRRIKTTEFKTALEDEGYYVEHTSKKIDDDAWKNGRWVIGLGLYVDWKKRLDEEI